MLVGATAAWQYRQLSRAGTRHCSASSYRASRTPRPRTSTTSSRCTSRRCREARRGDASTFSDPGRRAPFLAHSGLRPMFDGIALIDVAGNILLAEPPPVAKEVSVADRDYFRRARDTGVAAVSQPLNARTSGESAVLMAVPVKDADGRVLGVLGGGLNLHRPNMLGNLAAARLSGEGYYIVDSGGESPVYVVHPDPARVLQPVQGGKADTEWRQPDDLESSAKIAATGWNVHVVLPARTAYAPLAKARRALLLQMLLLAVVTGALVWAGTLWLVRPLGSLHSVIRRLRRNPDAPVLLDARVNDEYGDLAREFDALMTELRTQRSEKAALTDAAPVGLFRCDERGRMVDVNDAYLAIHGIERAQAADGWLGCVRPEQREETWRQWLVRVASNEPFQLKRWIRRTDGSSVLVSLQMQPIVAAGRVVGQVGTLIDITERTLAEQALRTQTAIFEKTTDYVVQLDKHGRLSYMNPAARLRTGVAQDAPVTHFTMADFMPPATLLRLRETIVPTAVSRGVWVGESDICGAHPADVFPVSHMVIAHRDKAGKIERFSGIMRDISEAKATEVALFESEARLRTIADALPMRVAFMDTSQRYRFVNRAYEGAFGIPREAIVGRTVKELFGSRFHSIEAHVARALQGAGHVSRASWSATAATPASSRTTFPSAASTAASSRASTRSRPMSRARSRKRSACCSSPTRTRSPGWPTVPASTGGSRKRWRRRRWRPRGGLDVPGPRPLQAGQRPVRPWHRRCLAARSGRPAGPGPAGTRFRRPRRRRRVHGDHRAGGRRPDRGTHRRQDRRRLEPALHAERLPHRRQRQRGCGLPCRRQRGDRHAADARRRRDALPGQGRGPQRLPAGGVSRGARNGLRRGFARPSAPCGQPSASFITTRPSMAPWRMRSKMPLTFSSVSSE